MESYDNISPFAPGVHIAVSLDDLLERIAPIDDRLECSRPGELREQTQIIWSPRCWSCDDLPAAGHRHPRDLKHVRQPTQHYEQASSLAERAFAAREPSGAGRIHNDVIGLALLREVLPGVIDDATGTERSHQFYVRGTAHAGDEGSEVLGKLHRRCAHPSGGAIDEDFLAALHLSSSEEIQGRRSAGG